MNAQSLRPRFTGLTGLLALTPLLAACLGGTDTPRVSASPPNETALPTAPVGVLVSQGDPQAPAGKAATPRPSTKPKPSHSAKARPAATPRVEQTQVVAYYLLEDPLNKSAARLVPVARVVPRTPAMARTALVELLRGESWDDSQGVRSEIPTGTRLLGLTIERGTATVNLSPEFEGHSWAPSMGARLAQIVYTMTRFQNIQRVIVHVNGEPSPAFFEQGASHNEELTRDNFLEYLPSIFVDSPAFGGRTGAVNTVRIHGKANVFEARFQLAVIDGYSGELVKQVAVDASCGTGCWGDFDVTVPVRFEPDQTMQIKVYTLSARDGSPENVREYWAQAGQTPKYHHDGCGC